MNKFPAVALQKEMKPGMYADGGGLYLQVTKSGAKSWIFRFMLHGKAREMGLGPLHTVTLAEARTKARDCHKQRLEGIDPIEVRRERRTKERLAAATAMTFKECADAYIKAHRAGWKNTKHAKQWSSTLAAYVYPIFGDLPVQAVDTRLVMRALEPIWNEKPETASRVRGRTEAVLDWATARGYRQGENPARWRGHLDHLFPARSKVAKGRHFPALPYAELSSFMEVLRKRGSTAARALELTILCAVRTGDVIGSDRDDKPPMRWSHVNLEDRVWTIPSTKTETEHRVPLSDAATKLLEESQKSGTGGIVFPGTRAGKPLSNMAMTKVIRDMNEDRTAQGLPRFKDPRQNGRDVTVHGFRSSFRDWAAESTGFPAEVVEMALAHTIGDKVEAAYRRGDLFRKRRQLMDAWARYCVGRA
jgi:integrase